MQGLKEDYISSMADNLNIFTRIKRIDGLLSNGQDWTIADICLQFGIDPITDRNKKRNFENDIKLLQEYCRELDIEIIAETKGGRKYIRYKDPSRTIFRRELNEGERALLAEMMALVLQFDGLPNKELIDNLGVKLGVVATEHRAISLSENPFTFNPEHFSRLFTSIIQKRTVQVDYQPFGKDKRSYTLSPYLLKEYNRRWFLIAADEQERLLTLSLDRIKSVDYASKKYKPSKYDWEEYFEDIVGVTRLRNAEGQEVKAVEILFWVSEQTLPYVLAKEVHSSMRRLASREEELRQEYPTLEGGAFFMIKCIPNYELYRELASFGEDLVVLFPKEIQDEVYTRLNRMVDRYKHVRMNISQAATTFALSTEKA